MEFRLSAKLRFLECLDQSGGPESCWPYRGRKARDGYGRFWYLTKRFSAHRVAFFISGGKAPESLIIRHTCDNPICCNPAHLTPGTQRDNMADRTARGRTASGTKNGRAKLTPQQVIAIRSMYVPYAFGCAKIASITGVNEGIVRDIITGKTWKSVPPDIG